MSCISSWARRTLFYPSLYTSALVACMRSILCGIESALEDTIRNRRIWICWCHCPKSGADGNHYCAQYKLYSSSRISYSPCEWTSYSNVEITYVKIYSSTDQIVSSGPGQRSTELGRDGFPHSSQLVILWRRLWQREVRSDLSGQRPPTLSGDRRLILVGSKI